MLVEEDGIYDIFKNLRYETLGQGWSPFHCFYCTSVWVSIPLSFFTGEPIKYFLVLSAMSIFIYSVHERIK